MTLDRTAGETLGTVQRVVELIRFLAERTETTLKEVSQGLGLAPSTCHRLLDLLARDGLVTRDGMRRGYRIGPELLRISAQVQAKQDMRAVALPCLRKVVALCDETSVLSLYLPNDGKIFHAEKIDSSRGLGYPLLMNTRLSVLWGATGRAILAHLAKADVDRIYVAEGGVAAAREPPPQRAALDRDLASIRKRGFAVSFGQRVSGTIGISAPVFRADGAVVASLGVTVPDSRIKRGDEAPFGDIVRVVAAELSAALGAPPRGDDRALA